MSLSISRRHLLKFLSLTGMTTAISSLPIKANEVLSTVDPAKDGKDDYSLIVGGTKESRIGQFSSTLADLFKQNIESNPLLSLQFTTGYDSVTASNLFDTRLTQDGSIALITSGSAIIAALAADPRVHFDYQHWIPVFSTITPIIVISRQPFHNSIPDLLKNRTMKVGVSTLIGKELPTLLGIELLQISTKPVIGITTLSTGIEALRNRTIDILQIDSPEGFAELPKLLAEEFHIFFSFDQESSYSPSFSSLYTKLPHYRTGNTLFEIWQTLALAARINFAVFLPMLTPSALVTKWRLNFEKITDNPYFQSIVHANNIVTQNSLKTIDNFSKLIPSATATLALRRWLSLKISQWEN